MLFGKCCFVRFKVVDRLPLPVSRVSKALIFHFIDDAIKTVECFGDLAQICLMLCPERASHARSRVDLIACAIAVYIAVYTVYVVCSIPWVAEPRIHPGPICARQTGHHIEDDECVDSFVLRVDDSLTQTVEERLIKFREVELILAVRSATDRTAFIHLWFKIINGCARLDPSWVPQAHALDI